MEENKTNIPVTNAKHSASDKTVLQKYFIPVFIPLFTAFLAFYGVKLGYESANNNAREMWQVERQAIVNEKIIDIRMSLFSRATSILYKSELLSAIESKGKMNVEISQLKPIASEGANKNFLILKEAYDNKITLNEYYSEFASVMQTSIIYFGPKTEESITQLTKHSEWWKADSKFITSVIDSMKEEFKYGLSSPEYKN